MPKIRVWKTKKTSKKTSKTNPNVDTDKGFSVDMGGGELTPEQRTKIKLAKIKEKYAYKTKKAKYANMTATTASTGGSVAGTVAGANYKADDVKQYTYNYNISNDSDLINNMEETGNNAGTSSSTSKIGYWRPGSEEN